MNCLLKEKSDPSIFIPSDGLGMELHRILKRIDDMVDEEEKFWIAIETSEIVSQWLTFGDMLWYK